MLENDPYGTSFQCWMRKLVKTASPRDSRFAAKHRVSGVSCLWLSSNAAAVSRKPQSWQVRGIAREMEARAFQSRCCRCASLNLSWNYKFMNCLIFCHIQMLWIVLLCLIPSPREIYKFSLGLAIIGTNVHIHIPPWIKIMKSVVTP